MQAITILLLVLISIVFGVLASLGYMVLRMLKCEAWDSSNMTNALRLISHMVLHPNDFPKMYYLTEEMKKVLKEKNLDPKKPFWYVDKDELSEVVDTRS